MEAINESKQPRRRSDGEETHAAILDKAVKLASIEGVNQITIGRLAQATGVSKSGVYAHFRSKERLQMEIIQAATEIFSREVIEPAMQSPDGLARLISLYEHYLSYVEREVFPGGCFLAGLISEFDAQTGPIHDIVAEGRKEWDQLVESLAVTARERGEINPDTDPKLLIFKLDAINDHTNFLFTLYKDPVMIERGRQAMFEMIDEVRAG